MSNYKDGNVVGGVAENDLKGIAPTQILVDGKMVICPFYSRWLNVVRREHCADFLDKNPSYLGVTVQDGWLKRSNFEAWMKTQNWEGLDLDKDILFQGNRHYGPYTCVFVPQRINKLLNTNKSRERKYPLGVTYMKKASFMTSERTNPYAAQVRTYVGSKNYQRFIGSYGDPQTAHRAWQWGKAEEIENAVAWYATQDCFRTGVADALLLRVWQLRLDHANFTETTEII